MEITKKRRDPSSRVSLSSLFVGRTELGPGPGCWRPLHLLGSGRGLNAFGKDLSHPPTLWGGSGQLPLNEMKGGSSLSNFFPQFASPSNVCPSLSSGSLRMPLAASQGSSESPLPTRASSLCVMGGGSLASVDPDHRGGYRPPLCPSGSAKGPFSRQRGKSAHKMAPGRSRC